jgi:hypothetical protein
MYCLGLNRKHTTAFILASLALVSNTANAVNIDTKESSAVQQTSKVDDVTSANFIRGNALNIHPVQRNLQAPSLADLLSFIALPLAAVASVVQNVGAMVVQIAQDPANIANIVSASVVNIVADVTTTIISSSAGLLIGPINDIVGGILAGFEGTETPLPNVINFEVNLGSGCITNYTADGVNTVTGLTTIRLDNTEIGDFDYTDPNLEITLESAVVADTITATITGTLIPDNMCAPELDFEAVTGFSSLFVQATVTLFATISDDGMMIAISEADFQDLTISGYDTYTLDVNEPSSNTDVMKAFKAALEVEIDGVVEMVDGFLTNTTNLLEDIGVPLPQEFPLPFPWPF